MLHYGHGQMGHEKVVPLQLKRSAPGKSDWRQAHAFTLACSQPGSSHPNDSFQTTSLAIQMRRYFFGSVFPQFVLAPAGVSGMGGWGAQAPQ